MRDRENRIGAHRCSLILLDTLDCPTDASTIVSISLSLRQQKLPTYFSDLPK
jgi:hypothetical protein